MYLFKSTEKFIMLNVPASVKIYLYDEPVSMLNGFEGLCLIIERFFEVEVITGGLFVFLNRKKDRMKVLYWDGDGLAIWYKRLERGTFSGKNFDQKILNRREFFMLLEGITPKRLQTRYSMF